MRIGVLLSTQTPEESSPEHFVSKSLAKRFLEYFPDGRAAVVRVSDSLLWIKGSMTFGQLKALLRPNPGPKPIPQILPPRGPEGLILSYPMRDQRSKRGVSYLPITLTPQPTAL